MADLSNGTTVTCSSLFGHAAAASAAGACPAAVSARTLARLFGVALRAVATAGSVAAVGVVLALRGVLTPDAKRLLSFLSMNVTIPALLFTQAAASLRPALLAYAWPLLLLPFVYVGAALLLGSVALRCADAPPELRRVLLAAAAFGNSTGMPIVLLSVVGDLLITPAARAEYGPAIDPLSYLWRVPGAGRGRKRRRHGFALIIASVWFL